MWEKPRIDGKRKLKHNAVPTIFPIVQKEKENKENPSHTVSHFQELHKTSIISDISEETCTTQRYNMEQDTEQINIQERSIQFHDAATSKSNDGELSLAGSALLEIEELKRKFNEANKKLHVANVVVHKAEKTNRNLLQRIRKLKRFRIGKSLSKSSEILRKVFNNDQIEWLQRDSPTRGIYKWSQEIIKKDDRERDCMLALDEVSLTPGIQYDPSTNSFIGHATIPNSHGKSTS
ncbi:uncharacterized protein LOC143896090 [Temnothorax americanus]|uniref:uncharacterized protein LOC143896090 n=1 Tax=Temnothorax americanus TaxID=1964332 RepID=UPI0040691557